ncbi:nitrogen regulation protein NR(II) [Ureibacillus sp. NPDC094379]
MIELKSSVESVDIDFHQLIENSLNAILILEKEGKVLYCNRACLNLLKLDSIESILYKHLHNFVPSYIHNICKKRLKNVLEKQVVIEGVEEKMIRSDGEIIDVKVRTVPLHLENRIYAQVVIQDITQRKRAEKLLFDREKLASLGQMAASIVHEVKNPLTSVKGFLNLLKESQPHVYLEAMESELEKAIETLQNLLQVSKPNLYEEPLSLIDTCTELKSLLFLFQDKLDHVKIELDFKDSERKIIGRRDLLLKAFFNLIKNAIEAIPHKGKIRIEHYYQNQMIHIKVMDSGIGIPKEKIKMLGTPFFTTKEGGTGLGLTQVYTTIHEHGGEICVQSLAEEGTVFHVQLPAK